jgi:16S rRNA (cytidine1402-2'-O)-methyltransferase
MHDRTLFLIPVGLTAENGCEWVGTGLRRSVLPLRRFVVEHPKSARQFLKALGLPLQELEIEVLDEHSKPADIDRLARWLDAGGDAGLLSEAGCPAIADPGANLVHCAHQLGIRVVPLVGPSSIVLALMASGLNGQRFSFNGYLPQAPAERDARIRELEQRSRKLDQTEIFIETPYRNETLLQALIANCAAETMLCVAVDLISSSEEVHSRTIAQWRQSAYPKLHKRPAVFLILSGRISSAKPRAHRGGLQ